VIVVDSSVWIDFFNGVSTPEVKRLDGLLGVMQGFRNEQDVATACIEANLPARCFSATATSSPMSITWAWMRHEPLRRIKGKPATTQS